MKKTVLTGLVLVGLASIPVRAAEVGLLLDKQVGASQAVLWGNSAPGTAGTPGSFNAVSPTGVGFRVGFSLLNLEVLDLGIVGTYHPSVQGNLVFQGNTLGTYSNQYEALGIQADWTLLLNLHVGMEYRSEKLTATLANGAADSETYLRPWMNAGIGLSLPLPVVKPFVRLEVAVPVTKKSNPVAESDFIKAMAPSLQVSLYGGIRF